MLAHAIATDEDALICDMAEYYGIYDYEQLPPKKVAALVYDLPVGSRTMRKITGINYSIEQLLIAGICDRIDWAMYAMAGGKSKGIPEPESMAARMTGRKQEKKRDIVGFSDSGTFEARRQQFFKGGA